MPDGPGKWLGEDLVAANERLRAEVIAALAEVKQLKRDNDMLLERAPFMMTMPPAKAAKVFAEILNLLEAPTDKALALLGESEEKK